MNLPSFDFDEWAALAKADPAAFAQRRAALIEALISSATPEQQRRLRCLQWRIDMDRQRCSNPMQACMLLFNKMWDSMYGGHGLLNALLVATDPHTYSALTGAAGVVQKPIQSATVLSFRPVK